MPSKFVKQVTVTGADDSVDVESLIGLSVAYPFVEFGILVSRNNAGNSPRFPSREWIDRLWELQTPDLNLSMHLCGTWVRSLCIGDGLIFKDWISNYFDMFNRIQLNFHAQPTRANVQLIHGLRSINKPVIFQMDGVNENLYRQSLTYHVDSYPLYDLSGGCGVLPENWPKPQGSYCGYAGGLSPDNIKGQLEKLSGIAGDTPIWVDFETYARTDDGLKFDVDKVIRFLEVAKLHVI